MLEIIVKNTLFQGIGKFGVVLLAFATTALLTRLLGVDGYGSYAFITALVLFFANFSDWGTNIITVREASQNKDKQPVIFGSVILFRLLLAVVAFVLLNILIRANPNWNELVVPTTIASFVFFALSIKTSGTIVFQTLLRLEKSAIVEIVASLLFLFFVLWIFTAQKGLPYVMWAWVGSTVFAGIAAFVLMQRLLSIRWGIDFKIIKKVFWEALPAGALLLVFYIYNRIDIVILEHFGGSLDVGIYGLAYKVHDNLVLGAAFLMNAAFPYLAKMFAQKNTSLLREFYQKAFDILLVTAFFVLVFIFLAAPLIINLLGGMEFFNSVGVLRILVFATAIAYFNHLTGYSLIAFGRQKVSLAIALVALTFNIVANWIFIPIFSYTAAAVITIATEGLVLVLSTVAIWRLVGIFPLFSSFPQTWVILFKGLKKW